MNQQTFLFIFFRLEVLQVVFIVIAVAMGVLAILLLIFGILATGDTRKNVYSGAKCIMGGRVMAAFVSIWNSYKLTWKLV